MGRRLTLWQLALSLLAASPAAAIDDWVDLELIAPLSIVDRSTIGTAEHI